MIASTMKIADAKISAPLTARGATRARRTYARQFKSEVVAQCLVPGASVSAIALSHGINANVIRKWLPSGDALVSGVTMLPVSVAAARTIVKARPVAASLRTATRPCIELTMNNATVRVPAGFDPADLRGIVEILAALR
jgi:transposase-like protein